MQTLPEGWIEKKDASGGTVYFNVITQEYAPQLPNQTNSQYMQKQQQVLPGIQSPNSTGYYELEEDAKLKRGIPQNQGKSQSNQVQQKQQGGIYSIWEKYCSLQVMSKYFMINKKDIQERLQYSFYFWSNEFYLRTQSNPDIYGPFWIYTTLIFIFSVMGNLSRHFSNQENDPDYVLQAASLFYSVGFLVPILLGLLLRLLGSQSILANYICIYGYSFTIFIPISFLEAIPNAIVQIIVLIIAGGLNILFLVKNLDQDLESQIQRKKWIGIGIIVAIQFFLLFAYKAYFSDEVFVAEKTSSST